MKRDDADRRGSRRRRWSLLAPFVVAAYVFSSGPVIAAGFWLRQVTRWEGFYAVMWLYYPLLSFGPNSLPFRYVGWWVELFGTVGPG